MSFDSALTTLAAEKSWQDKYRVLLQLADNYTVDSDIRRNENLVHGCESLTWLGYQYQNDSYVFYADSESRIIKGLLVLILAQLINKHAEDIQNFSLEALLVEGGLQRHLSLSRSNGLNGVVQRIHSIAASHL